MSIYTSSLAISIRSLARRAGLAKCIQRLINKNKSYEELFESAVLGAVKVADCVWDVGANVGVYTEKMSNLVGPSGHVVAFEPSSINYEKLKDRCGNLQNVVLRSEALGDAAGRVMFRQGEDAIGATSRVMQGDVDDSGTTRVQVERGDTLVNYAAVPMPNVVKVDTEGFEVEVLKGLEGVLEHPELRTIGIEVHFGILAQRGLERAPAEMEDRLKRAGFIVRWVDLSHMLASR